MLNFFESPFNILVRYLNILYILLYLGPSVLSGFLDIFEFNTYVKLF